MQACGARVLVGEGLRSVFEPSSVIDGSRSTFPVSRGEQHIRGSNVVSTLNLVRHIILLSDAGTKARPHATKCRQHCERNALRCRSRAFFASPYMPCRKQRVSFPLIAFQV